MFRILYVRMAIGHFTQYFLDILYMYYVQVYILPGTFVLQEVVLVPPQSVSYFLLHIFASKYSLFLSISYVFFCLTPLLITVIKTNNTGTHH